MAFFLVGPAHKELTAAHWLIFFIGTGLTQSNPGTPFPTPGPKFSVAVVGESKGQRHLVFVPGLGTTIHLRLDSQGDN